MSIDIVATIDNLTALVLLFAVVLTMYRGLEMGRAFVNRIYRYRAFWIVALCMMALVDIATDQVPFLQNASVGGVPVPIVTLFLTLMVVFAFADSTIMVTLEMDFFHRNTLRWRQGRLIAYPLLYGEFVVFFFLTFLASLPSPLLAASEILDSPVYQNQALPIIVVLVGYFVVSVVVGAHRTPDRTMKRHVTLLGLLFALFAVIFVNDLTISIDLFGDLITLALSYVLYRAVMTLSPLNRVEKETATPTVHANASFQLRPELKSV